jgi:hypothetical protein
VTTTSTETFVDFLGNVLTVPAVEKCIVQMLSTERGHGRRKAVLDANVADWRALEIDQKISLWRGKSFVAWGIVDGVMRDGSAVWIFIPKEFRRTLVHTSDGITISLADR